MKNQEDAPTWRGGGDQVSQANWCVSLVSDKLKNHMY